MVVQKAYGLAHRGHEIPNELDTRFAHRERCEGHDGAHGREPRRGRGARARDHGPLDPRRRSPAHRRRRDRRAPARPSLGDRRLPRRGVETDDHRVPHAGPGARAGSDRGVPRRARRPSSEVRAGREVLVLQRRLRRARVGRGAGQRRSLPRARGAARVRAGRDAGHVVPALRRAARAHCDRLPLRRRAPDERPPPSGARVRRRRHLHDGCGHPALCGVRSSVRGSSRSGGFAR